MEACHDTTIDPAGLEDTNMNSFSDESHQSQMRTSEREQDQ